MRRGSGRGRAVLRFSLLYIAGLVALALGVAGNLLSYMFPDDVPVPWWQSVLVGVVAVVLVGVGVVLQMIDRDDDDPGPGEIAARVDELEAGSGGFIGRATLIDELEVMCRAQRPDGPTVILLHGESGVGKTEAVRRLARRVAPDFPDGTFLVALHGYSRDVAPTDPASALDELLLRMGVPRERIPPTSSGKSATFRSHVAGLRCVLVVDDVLRVADLDVLRPAAPGSVVLVTSRHDLAEADGLVRRRVRPFLPHESVDYLVDRLSDVPVRDAEIAETARLCAHVPFALRLAASAVRRGSGSVAEVNDGFREETDRLPGLEVGEASVRAAYRVQLRTLSPLLLRALRGVGAVGLLDYDALTMSAIVDGGADTGARVVEELVACSLLDRAGDGRAAAHDLIRIFTREEADSTLTTPERVEIVRRTTTALRDRAEREDRRFHPHAGLAEDEWRRGREAAIAWFDAVRANLPVMVDRAAEAGCVDVAAELAAATFHYLDHRRAWSEWERIFEAGVAAARRGTPGTTRVLAKLLCALGLLRWEQSRWAEAERLQRESLALAIEIGDGEREGWALNHLGNALAGAGGIEESLEAQADAVACFDREGIVRGAAWGWNQIGDAAAGRADRDAADAAYRESLERFERAEDHFGIAIVRANCGVVALEGGDFATARAMLGAARAGFDELRNLYETARVDVLLARVASAEGDHRSAAALLDGARLRFRESSLTRAEADATLRLAEARWALGSSSRARALLRHAVDLAAEHGHDDVLDAARRTSVGRADG